MSLYPVEKINIGERYRKDLGDIDALAQSIQDVGLIHPIIIDTNGNLVAGLRRLKAVKKLCWPEVEIYMMDLKKSALHAEQHENVCRKDFTPSEAVAIAEAIEREERKAAKRRQRDGQERGRKKQRGEKTDSEKFSETDQEQRRSESRAAKAVGMSRPTYRKAKEVVEAAHKKPRDKKIQSIKEEMDATGKVDRAHKKLKEVTGDAKPERPQFALEQLKRVWNKASAEERREFLEWVKGEENENSPA